MWFVILLAFLVWILANGRFQIYADLATVPANGSASK